ncbi:helix-turn-helix domain-containing protein [Nocardia sp. NPDC004068]|uniref:helix-turn-helix domain-containing protein n=1 Tax=Nocardia sp. NPDC004068 TaxID=3364303 RepID=UPI00367A71C2
MPRKAGLAGTTLPRRRLGRALRDARQALGLTLDQVVAAVGGKAFSRATLSRIENGQSENVSEMEVEYLCKQYLLNEGKTEYLKTLVAMTDVKVWFEDSKHLIAPGFGTYLELEAFASEFWFYQPILVPGLLQTADYARTLETRNPAYAASTVETRVQLRMRRSEILTRDKNPAAAEFIIHENVLYSGVGSNHAMREQLGHIIRMGRRRNISIRVLPFSNSAPTGSVIPPHIILDFPDDEPSVVYTEAAIGSTTFEDQDRVERFRALNDILREASLDESVSRDRIKLIARRYQ